jgi:PIN domain nuclease of toxin-antitoxin system
MSRFLLDTHAFLWFVFDDPRLSDHAEEIILDPDIEKVLSIGSLWEIVIKSQLDKLRLGMTIEDFFRSHVVDRVLTLLPIELDHLVEYSELPLHHRDPFDRLLVAQARSLGIPVVTGDTKLSAYEVETLW